jgi:putative acetyltransferase
VIFRGYKPSDLAQLVEVYTKSVHDLAAPFYTLKQLEAWAPSSPDLDQWQRRLDQLRIIVAEENGIMAGFISYQLDGYIFQLYTHPVFARRAVASRLYLQAESELRSSGVVRVFTEASLVARTLFERHGFQVDREECVERRGEVFRRFVMHKSLAPAEGR